LFFREFLRHPVMIGSIIPSSRRTIDAMLSPVDWPQDEAFRRIWARSRYLLRHHPRTALGRRDPAGDRHQPGLHRLFAPQIQ
jgi:hypothetical protein